MSRVGFHCSHEQHPPSNLLQLAVAAQRAGFTHAMCSDHFHPWGEAQGHSGFSWAWLGAALQATHLTFGTVSAPGQRYHPAVVAQAAATLADLSPERFWLAVGSGEALNEAITGDPWPSKPDRNARLLESVEVMRALWRGETVTHDGLVHVREAKLYGRPTTLPRIFAAAMSEETARWAGRWADGLITVAGDRDAMRGVLRAFRDGGGEGKPVFLQVCVAYGRSQAESEATAVVQWRQAALTLDELADLPTPRAFDQASARVSPRTVLKKVRACADMERQRDWIHEDLEMGFARVYVHNVVRDHTRFFEDWASRPFDTATPPRGAQA
jgi:probable non-F420 flavinoid oxidoreductase